MVVHHHGATCYQQIKNKHIHKMFFDVVTFIDVFDVEGGNLFSNNASLKLQHQH
jgi:hypothetical protein